jgi:glycosyltransferase involved in cell wall biosynthesis
MKIAFLNKYQNKAFRGAETFVYELSKRLSEHHDVDIISDINYFDLWNKKYDVIIPTNGRFQVFLTRKITWLKGSKMVVSGQSGMGWDDRLNLYSFPNAFVALSAKALKWAKRINSFVRSVYIPNGVDLEKFKPVAPKRDGKTILCVGAFTKQKRINLAIDAVAKLKDTSLIVAGGGGEMKEKILDYGIKYLGKDRFEMISVPYEKMPEIYRRANVFTLPSKSSEAFGNVIVEAMASGLPVVATDDSVRKEIVGDAGILVDPTNVEEYANALSDALAKDWDDKPRKQAEKFDWDIVAKQYEELFKNISS